MMGSKVNVVCYNMHGFSNGVDTLKELCLQADITALEEHWLAPFNLDKLSHFDHSFQGYGWSAMTEKINSGFLSGRPFGGLRVLIRKSINVCVQVLDVMHNCRVVGLGCTFPNGYKILLFIVYFPCSGNNSDYDSELLECPGFIEQCAAMYDYHNIMVLGDMNFECESGSRGYTLFKNMVGGLV